MKCPHLKGEDGKKQFPVAIIQRHAMLMADFKCSATGFLFTDKNDPAIQKYECLNDKHTECEFYKKEKKK